MFGGHFYHEKTYERDLVTREVVAPLNTVEGLMCHLAGLVPGLKASNLICSCKTCRM